MTVAIEKTTLPLIEGSIAFSTFANTVMKASIASTRDSLHVSQIFFRALAAYGANNGTSRAGITKLRAGSRNCGWTLNQSA